MKVILLHAFGQTAFDSEAVLAYGSLDSLIASDLLAGIPNRVTSLCHLWEAANLPEQEPQSQPQEKGEEATAGAEAAE